MTNTIILTKETPAIMKLADSDPRINFLVNLIGDFTLTLRTDYFSSLVRAIIGQQLSVKAAGTIWRNTVQTLGQVQPDTILAAGEEKLRVAGISRRKILYIQDLSQKVLDGEINLALLCHLNDHEVILTLTSVKGIGRWTAEMFLIFSLDRPDILSAGDMGLRRAVKWLYGLDKTPDYGAMEHFGEKWRPYRSTASLYLWEAINRGYIRQSAAEVLPV